MLLKLFKYDMKSVSPALLLIFGATLILSYISGKIMYDYDQSSLILFQVFNLLLFGMFFVSSIGIHVVLIRRYNQRMYLDQAYLYNSLPVSKDQLMVSHILAYVVWDVLSQVMLGLSLLFLSDMAIYDQFIDHKEGLNSMLLQNFDISLNGLIGFSFAFIILQALLYAVFCHFTSAIANFFPTKRTMVLVLCYAAGIIVYSICLVNVGSVSSADDLKNNVLWLFFVTAILVLVIYLINRYLLKRKYNLI